MKLFFLDPTSRLATNIHRLKNCGFNANSIIAQDARQGRQAIIVLGDGSPEDKVLGVISYHLNGNSVIGIAKPIETHLAVLDQLKTYVEESNAERILIVIDQDNWTLDDIFSAAERRIHGIGIDTLPQEINEPKVRQYQCTLGYRSFGVIIVVSGLDDFNTTQHMIEDHLLRLAGFDEAENPKQSWREQLDEDERENIFKLFLDKDVVEVTFPQHVSGCGCFEQHDPEPSVS